MYKVSFLLLFLALSLQLKAQLVYFTATTGQSGFNNPEQIWVMNLSNCQYCPVSGFTLINPPWMHILPNGDLLVQENNGTITRYTLPDFTPVWTSTPGFNYFNPYTHPNGNIYITNFTNTLYTFDPANNTFNAVGNFPPGINMGALIWYNGSLHGFGGPPSGIYQIPVNNPGAATYVGFSIPTISSVINTASDTILISWTGGGSLPQTDFGIYDIPTGSVTPICPTPLNSVGALAEILPPNVPPPCICLPSSAGLPVTNTVFNACAPDPANVTAQFDGNVVLDFNDGVNYILYTDPNNITGSILAQNNNGIFPFLSTYVIGTTYYIARIVGNIQNTVVNLGDPCLDISPSIELIWREKPTIISLTTLPEVCAGACVNVNLNIQGTPPFGYGWQWQQNGNPSGYFFDTGVPGNPILFEACAPLGSTGALELVICTITDAYCGNL